MTDQSQNDTEELITQNKINKSPFMSTWRILLLVYSLLFVSTAFLAFRNIEIVAPEIYTRYASISDPEIRAIALKILKVEDTERSNRQKLATQSFNVVLGALLGFLSATFVPLLQRRKEE